MAKRFIVDKKDITINSNHIVITGSECAHICALRKQINDCININEMIVKITSKSHNEIAGDIVGTIEQKGSNINITLLPCMLKGDKMEFVIQKAVELGATCVCPVTSKNCVVKIDEKSAKNKHERYIKIAKEAIGQCGRTDEVQIKPITRLMEALDSNSFDTILVCHENASDMFDEKTCQLKNVACIIGPEGGLDDKEVEQIVQKYPNAKAIRISNNILRAETASIYMLSVLQYIENKRDER